MRINLTSVFVDDQDEALRLYTEVLGLHDVPMGEYRWITVVSPEDPGGTELGSAQTSRYMRARAADVTSLRS